MSTSENSSSSTQQESQDQKSTPPPLVKVKIQKMLDGESKIKAFASVTINGTFAAHGLKVLEGENGLFVAMPSSSYKSGEETKYQNFFHPVTEESRNVLIAAVLDAYAQALAKRIR